MAAVTVHSDFRAQENEICAFTFPPSICHEVMGSDAMILAFVMLSFKSAFSFLSFTLIKSSCILHFLTLDWYHQHIWGCWYFSWPSWFQLMIYQAQHFTWYTLHGLQQTGSKQEKEAVYCHPAYLTHMLSTSWGMLGWKKHKLNQDFQEKYQ